MPENPLDSKRLSNKARVSRDGGGQSHACSGGVKSHLCHLPALKLSASYLLSLRVSLLIWRTGTDNLPGHVVRLTVQTTL